MSLHERLYHAPLPLVIGPVKVSCPRCDRELGSQVRITLETARRAAQRPAPTEALLICGGCRRLYVAALALSPGGRMAVVQEVAA
jgi:LSD1 subclass zinc finger protein